MKNERTHEKNDGTHAEIGIRLRKARQKRGLTQESIAEKVGICPTYLSDIERGKKMPSLGTFIKIMEVLGTSADYVLGRNEGSATAFICDDLAQLTPKQRRCISDIVDAYLRML